MSNIMQILGTSTPVSEVLAQKIGFIRAGIACRIFFYQQLKNGVCSASIATIAKKLGLASGTVSTNIKWLRENGYIDTVGEHKSGNVTNKYIVTQKFYDSLEHSLDESEHSLDESNIHEMNGEEEIEEDLEEKGIPITDFELIQSAIKEACKVATNDRNKGQLLRATREAQNTGKTPEQILEFGRWYNQTYWPGKYPNITQISSDWPKFEERGKTNGKSSTPVPQTAQQTPDGGFYV